MTLAAALAASFLAGCGGGGQESTATTRPPRSAAADVDREAGDERSAEERTSASAEKSHTFITVAKVPFYFMDKGISFADENGDEFVMPKDIGEWFSNAEFEGVYSLGEDTEFERDESIVKEFYTMDDQILAKGSSILFVFIVEGEEYQLALGVGTKFAVEETGGAYSLLPDKTEGMEARTGE